MQKTAIFISQKINFLNYTFHTRIFKSILSQKIFLIENERKTSIVVLHSFSVKNIFHDKMDFFILMWRFMHTQFTIFKIIILFYRLKAILFPTLICLSYNNIDNKKSIAQEVSPTLLGIFLEVRSLDLFF